MLDVASVKAQLCANKPVLLHPHAGSPLEFETAGYILTGTSVLACVSTWRHNATLVECATYVSSGPDWQRWSEGGAEYVSPISQEDHAGSIGTIVGMVGDLPESDDMYVLGVAGWADEGVEVLFETENVIAFRNVFVDAPGSYFAVPIAGNSQSGQIPELGVRFNRL